MARASKKKTDDADLPITIKKYANRRLYHTQKSSYVTLDDLSAMVRNGEDFVVKDAKSGDDITRSVLSQIIFDAEARGENMLPPNFLRQIIGLYGGTMQNMVPGYLESTMDHFVRNQERVRESFEKNFTSNPAIAGFGSLTRANMEWFERSMKMFGSRGGSGQSESDKDAEIAALKEEVASLKRALEEKSEE